MTEFEQQVAEALRTIKFSGGTGGLVALPMDDEHIEKIAPRVAAAIEQGARTGCAIGRGSEKQGQPLEASLIVAVAQARGEALHVLRGDP